MQDNTYISTIIVLRLFNKYLNRSKDFCLFLLYFTLLEHNLF